MRLASALIGFCLCASAAIRPAFSVVESIKGSTLPGAVIALPALHPEPDRARPFDRVMIDQRGFLEPGSTEPPLLGPTDRLIVSYGNPARNRPAIGTIA